MTPREHVNQLLDELNDDQLAAVEQYLVAITQDDDPVLKALLEAEIDDEPVTPEDLEKIEKGREAVRQGRVVSLEEAERRLLNR